jgi:L-fucose mutarotase
MQVMPGDLTKTPIWKSYEDMIAQVDERGKTAITTIDRFEFYKEAAKAYAIVATGETALYASVLLQKGVLVGME